MNFFERQAQARRRTWMMVGWMLLAVAGITAAMNAAACGVALLAGLLPGTPVQGAGTLAVAGGALAQWFAEPWWILVTCATLIALLAGSLVRYVTISKGGRAIADMIDARRVDLSSREERDRRFINVVEEMSIASGTPRPALYVMEQEEAINAFVAGTRPRDAIMVVTRGALEKLSRDELQGVVAHEYSHILNGDMRLNGRLMAIVAGILLFGKLGEFMLRGVRGGSRYGRHRRRNFVRGDSRVMLAWFAAGIALFVIGYLGLFFGRVIKAAASRQRELLADASSVQFTRNPDGISGALWRISEDGGGSLLASAYAEDMSHMCFGQSVVVRFSGLLATHPPIEQRLAAIDPQFRARRVARRVSAAGQSARTTHATASVNSPAGSTPGGSAGPLPGPAFAGAALAATGATVAVDADTLGERVGNPQPEHNDYARELHERLPAPVLDAAHEAEGAEALVYALLLGELAEPRLSVAQALIGHQAGRPAARRAATLRALLLPLGESARLPVLDLAAPLLAEQSTETRERVLAVSDKLSRLDSSVSLFEFALLALLHHHIGEVRRSDRPRFFSLSPVVGDIRRLLSLLARAGATDEAAANLAFRRAASGFADGSLTLASVDQCDPGRMHEALSRIALLSPLLKRPVLEACADCVQHDGEVTVTEAELLRAIAESLDCPLPPLLPGNT